MLEPLALIVALTRLHEIGRGGALPWHLPEDLAHFKRTTLGHAIVMGRRTYASIGRPLPKRHNLVVSGSPIDGVETFPSLDAALVRARALDPMPFVIGGARLYEAALPLATDLHLTWVDQHVDGADTFFPPLDLGAFDVVERRTGEDPRLSFEHWKRRGSAASLE